MSEIFMTRLIDRCGTQINKEREHKKLSLNLAASSKSSKESNNKAHENLMMLLREWRRRKIINLELFVGFAQQDPLG